MTRMDNITVRLPIRLGV